MNFTIKPVLLEPLLALVVGILILLVPRFLNYLLISKNFPLNMA